MPKARNCYFEDEMELSFYEKYTFINCQLECAIKEVEKDLGCVPWHLPRVIKIEKKNRNITPFVYSQRSNSTTYDPWEAEDFEAQMTEVQSNSTKICPHCLPDCDHIAYSSTTYSTEFRWI